MLVVEKGIGHFMYVCIFFLSLISNLSPNITLDRDIQISVNHLCHSLVLLLSVKGAGVFVSGSKAGFMLAEKEGFGLPPMFTTFLCVHVTVLGNCRRINTCLGNTFPPHPNLLLNFPMVEDFLLKNKRPASSKWKIILNSYLLWQNLYCVHKSPWRQCLDKFKGCMWVVTVSRGMLSVEVQQLLAFVCVMIT